MTAALRTMAAEQAAVLARGVDFDLSHLRLSVITYQGTVQVLFVIDGFEGGPRKVGSNLFCDTNTADQLRAVAAHLDTLFADGGADARDR